jgi:hypothetical protein
MKNFVVGGNANDTHLLNANWDRDFQVETFADLRQAQAGDPSPRTQTPLSSAKGIEVGHVFLLGTKYSQAMGATFLDEQGKETLPIMGCYGIGVSRTAAASIEQNHDTKGMIWPAPIALFHVHLLPVTASEKVLQTTQTLYQALAEAGVEVLWDDRDERAGVKFNDADLIGAPYHVTIGDKGLGKGIIEIKHRRTGEVAKIEPNHVTAYLTEQLSSFQLPHTGMFKKAASGVLALLPCSRTGSTLRASKGLRPCWTDFFEHSLPLTMRSSSGAFIGNCCEKFNSSTYLTAINCLIYHALANAGFSPVFPLKSLTYVDKSKNLVLIYPLWKGELR